MPRRPVPVLGDHAHVAWPRPARDVVRQLRSCQDRLDVSARPVRSPKGCDDEHLGEDIAVSRTGGTHADSHTGRVPQFRPLNDRRLVLPSARV